MIRRLVLIALVILIVSPVLSIAEQIYPGLKTIADSLGLQNGQIQSASNKNPLPADSVRMSAESGTNYHYTPVNKINSEVKLKFDSAFMAQQKRKQMQMVRMLAEGKVSMGYFHLDYNRLFGYNLYEGLKLGLGGETNRLLSTYFTIGGYFSFGLKDGALRHGEWFDIFPTGLSDYRIHLGYTDLNMEFGGPEFLETPSLLNIESYRLLMINNMFQQKRFTGGLEFRPFNELNLYFFGDMSENKANLNTNFLLLHSFNPTSLTRTGLQLRYSPGIRLLMEGGTLTEVTAPKADCYLTVIQGFKLLYGDYSYTKAELKVKFYLPFSKIGTTTIMVRGGVMSQNSPIMELFNGYGGFAGKFSLNAPFSFATMRYNEFASANFTAVHIRHDFSPWLFPEKYKTSPSFILAHNMGIGQLNDKYLSKYNLTDCRKGYFESGFEVNNLLKFGYLSWGVGVYYRYGPYQFSSPNQNFAYKFGFYLKL